MYIVFAYIVAVCIVYWNFWNHIEMIDWIVKNILYYYALSVVSLKYTILIVTHDK